MRIEIYADWEIRHRLMCIRMRMDTMWCNGFVWLSRGVTTRGHTDQVKRLLSRSTRFAAGAYQTPLHYPGFQVCNIVCMHIPYTPYASCATSSTVDRRFSISHSRRWWFSMDAFEISCANIREPYPWTVAQNVCDSIRVPISCLHAERICSDILHRIIHCGRESRAHNETPQHQLFHFTHISAERGYYATIMLATSWG